MKRILPILLVGLAVSQASQLFLTESNQPLLKADPVKVCPNDPSSYANCADITTTDFQLDVTIDFDSSSISGTNTLTLSALKDGVQTLVLDYQGINIIKVEQQNADKTTYTTLTYTS